MATRNDILLEKRYYEKQIEFKNSLLMLLAGESNEKKLSENLLNFIVESIISADKLSDEHKSEVCKLHEQLINYIKVGT